MTTAECVLTQTTWVDVVVTVVPWLITAAALFALYRGTGSRDDAILRRRERHRRRTAGHRLWWLLLPGWRHRS